MKTFYTTTVTHSNASAPRKNSENFKDRLATTRGQKYQNQPATLRSIDRSTRLYLQKSVIFMIPSATAPPKLLFRLQSECEVMPYPHIHTIIILFHVLVFIIPIIHR